jgi:hypothetical protein
VVAADIRGASIVHKQLKGEEGDANFKFFEQTNLSKYHNVIATAALLNALAHEINC